MQTAVVLEVRDYWNGAKEIKDVDININVDRHGVPLYIVDGINGNAVYRLLITHDREPAELLFNKIKSKILALQYNEMFKKYADNL